jgi:hypothetical protein
MTLAWNELVFQSPYLAVVKAKQLLQEGKMTEVDQELVECRRKHKETPRYRELKQQAGELIDNLEKHIVFAALIG